MKYSQKFKDRMLEQLTGPGAKSAHSLSIEVGVAKSTLSHWLKKAKVSPMNKDKSRDLESPHRYWNTKTKIRIVRDAAGLADDKLGAFLRREGLHEADLQRIREEVMEAATEGFDARSRTRGKSPEARRIQALEKELTRKEKALAETAALLVLQGKLEAFLSSEDEEGDTKKKSGR